MSQDKIIYHKRLVRSGTWKLVLTLWFLSGFIPALLDKTDENFISNFIIYGLVWGLPFLIWSLTLLSINFYGTITITTKKIRVGRNNVNISDVDSISLMDENKKSSDFIDRMIRTSSELDLPIKFLSAEKLGTHPVMGGAWGTPLISDSFVLTLKSGQKYIVPTPVGSRSEVIESILKAIQSQ